MKNLKFSNQILIRLLFISASLALPASLRATTLPKEVSDLEQVIQHALSGGGNSCSFSLVTEKVEIRIPDLDALIGMLKEKKARLQQARRIQNLLGGRSLVLDDWGVFSGLGLPIGDVFGTTPEINFQTKLVVNFVYAWKEDEQGELFAQPVIAAAQNLVVGVTNSHQLPIVEMGLPKESTLAGSPVLVFTSSKIDMSYFPKWFRVGNNHYQEIVLQLILDPANEAADSAIAQILDAKSGALLRVSEVPIHKL